MDFKYYERFSIFPPSDKYDDLVNLTCKECKLLGEGVKYGLIEETDLYLSFEKSLKINYTEEEAIMVITHLILISYYVPYSRTDYYAICYKALIHATEFIKVNGSVNFKIVNAVIRAQKLTKDVIPIEAYEDIYNRRHYFYPEDDDSITIKITQ